MAANTLTLKDTTMSCAITIRQVRARTALIMALSVLLCMLSCVRVTHRYETPAARADALKEQGKYEEAIKAYRAHLAQRIAQRGPEENPYFYLLLIGDCYIAMDQLQEAEESYREAHAQEVDKALVADRFRRLADWYENENELENAMALLQKYRHLDPLLFDLEIDRLHKAYVRRELQAESPLLAPASDTPKTNSANPSEIP